MRTYTNRSVAFGCPDGKYLLQITLFPTSSINASTISVSSACYADFCPRGQISPFCFLVPNKCILIIMIIGIGGKNMRFPIRHWTMSEVGMLQTLLSSRLYIPLMPGTKSAHVIVQSFHL